MRENEFFFSFQDVKGQLELDASYKKVYNQQILKIEEQTSETLFEHVQATL